MTRRIQAIFLAAALGAAGCSIPFASELDPGQNACSADSDCAEGSYCVLVAEARACVASSVDLEGLVFEVRPAIGNGNTVSSPALVEPLPLSASDGSQVITRNVAVPAYVDFSPGTVFLPCANGTAVPARVTFQPVPHILGLLEGEVYEAKPTIDNEGNEAFEASIPQGDYNLYLQPQPDLVVTPGCAVAPPIFLPGWTIEGDVSIAIHAAAPLLLTGTLKLSQKEDFTKWFLEVVEPFGGQPISEVIQPKQEGIALEVPFQLWFDWTARTGQDAITPIVRLRPPAGSGKPVFHWSLDAIALDGIQGDEQVPVTLDVSGIDTLARDVGGQVLHDGDQVPATVTLRSTSIGGSKFNRYEIVVETDDNGHFTSQLPPGEYTVVARPHSPDLALGKASWSVPPAGDCYCGKTIDVPSATTLAGSVVTPGGDPASVDVRLTPAANGDRTYLAKLIASEVQPRPASTEAEHGDFQLPVDEGLFDLSLVPPEGAGYPWLVRPRVLVSNLDSQEAPVQSLDELRLHSPVVLVGRISSAGGFAMSGATLRAWIAVGSTEPGTEPSAVQIGETVANVNGEYFLLLPPSIK
jgi:hypothetical protein